MPCDYCGAQYCRPNECENKRTSPLPKGIVCSSCGYQCVNIKWNKTDCQGKIGVDRTTYKRRKLYQDFMDKQR